MIPALDILGKYDAPSSVSLEGVASAPTTIPKFARGDKQFSSFVKMSVFGPLFEDSGVPYPQMSLDAPAPTPVSDANQTEGKNASPNQPGDPKKLPHGPMDGLVATKVDNTYFFTIDPFYFTDMDHEKLTRLKAWAHLNLKDTDAVRLSFGEQMFWRLPPMYFSTILNQISVLCAPSTAVVDRRLSNTECLMAFACDTLEVCSFGWMTLYPVSSKLPEDRSASEKAMASFPLRILQKAVANGWILQEDYDQLERGEPVLITYDDFAARADSAKNLTIV